VTALNAEGSGVRNAAERLRSTSAGTRALYLTSSALTGAVLYLLVSWPHPQAQPQRDTYAATSAVPARAVVPASTVSAQKPAEIAVPAVLEAVRAVAGSARAREAAVVAVAPHSTAAADPGPLAAAHVSPAPSTGTEATLTTSASVAPPGAVTTSAAPSSFTGASVDARQPATIGASPNRIGVPGSQTVGLVPNGMQPASGANRIGIPATPPR
jgi:hypothetical protein